MLTTIITFLTQFFQSTAGAVTTGSLIVWALGHFADTKLYGAIRKTFGGVMFKMGASLSKFGEFKLGRMVWSPLERIALDFLFFGTEQVAAGLRSDNVEKLEEHLERLKSVGSVSRAEAIAEKLDRLKNPVPIDLSDIHTAEIHARMLGGLKDSAEDKLKE